jgi:RND family efflux transporter MFP subunit
MKIHHYVYALLGTGLGIVGMGQGLAQGPAPMQQKPSTVLVQKAKVIANAVDKKYIGKIEAIDKVTVQPRVSGNILSIQFKEGETVKKGDLLFEIEDTRYKAAVDDAVARKKILEAKLEYARVNFDRNSKLLATKAISKDTVDNAQSTVHSLEAEIMAADAAIVTAQDELNYTRITAPVDGKAGRVTYSVGNYITPTSNSLVTITGVNPMLVRFPISERDFLSLFGSQDEMKKSAVVALTLANGKPYDQAGEIFMTDNTVKTTTDTLNVWVKFDNKDQTLTEGGVVTVNLSKNNVESYPSANISSVLHDAYKSYVYVLNQDNVVERRDVTLGNTINNEQCFKSGIQEGDVIIIDGMHKVQPGAKATPVYPTEG